MNPIKQISLHGSWNFIPENGEKSTITVPGGGWLKQGYDCEAAVYQREIKIPELENGSNVILELGAVNHIARYYIGKDESSLRLIDQQVTAFTAQRVDLTEYVESGETYLLKIEVRAWENGRPVAPHWAEWSECVARGIFRSAQLLIYPQVYIDDIFVKPRVESGMLEIICQVKNGGNEAVSIGIDGTLTSDSGENWEYPEIEQIQMKLDGGKAEQVRWAVAWTLPKESLWWPNTPYREGYRAQLHNLTLKLDGIHTATVRFGWRELKQVGDHFELNGVHINFRGDNLQVANYDRVDFGGKGNAIDTLPGFLPPSENCPGWPKAVDNFLRLNYNVQREHMGPWTDYMLDVCDEMGLMLIGESASRWNGFDMENDRGFYEEKCLKDIIKWHKNHPSVVRWSLKNEAQCLEPDYHRSLYDAVKSVDDTRPLFEDFLVGDRSNHNPEYTFGMLIDESDFTWMEHYMTYDENGNVKFDTIGLNDAVVPLKGRPYGITEADWVRSSTLAGATFFAITTVLARAQGASDVRPYTLLSYWASCIPGVNHTDFITEENRHPVYGEDNLPNPFDNDGLKLLSKACSPVLAADIDFFKSNRESDAFGHFPVTVPRLNANEAVERTVTIFNDLLIGGQFDLSWKVSEGSPDNRPWASGKAEIELAPGTRSNIKITFNAPRFTTYLFLTLTVSMGDKILFTDSSTAYEIVNGEEFRSEYNGEERIFK